MLERTCRGRPCDRGIDSNEVGPRSGGGNGTRPLAIRCTVVRAHSIERCPLPDPRARNRQRMGGNQLMRACPVRAEKSASQCSVREARVESVPSLARDVLYDADGAKTLRYSYLATHLELNRSNQRLQSVSTGVRAHPDELGSPSRF